MVHPFKLLVGTLLAIAISGCSQPEVPRKIFILAGQSNMSGRGDLSELPDFQAGNRILIYSNSEEWIQGREPIDDAAGQVDLVSSDGSARVGPGMAFANSLAERFKCIEVGIVPAAKGATLMSQWAPNLSRGTLYGSMIARAKQAAEEGEIAGLIWYQGESDSNDPALVDAWAGKFAVFVDAVRSDLRLPELPVIITILGPNRAPDRFLGWDRFVEMQKAMKLPARTVAVSANDLEGIENDPHLTTADYMNLGERYAGAMAQLMTAPCGNSGK